MGNCDSANGFWRGKKLILKHELKSDTETSKSDGNGVLGRERKLEGGRLGGMKNKE